MGAVPYGLCRFTTVGVDALGDPLFFIVGRGLAPAAGFYTFLS